MRLLQRLFLEHPASVNESYLEHLATAWSFAARMIAGGLACLIHGLIPGWFVRTGSDQVRCLHDRMVVGRVREVALQTHRATDGRR